MTRPSGRWRSAATLAMGVALCGCGSSFNGQVYQGHGLRFSVGETPRQWRRIDVSGALLSFRDDTSDAVIAVNARCGKDADDVPLQALTQHLLFLFTERSIIEQRVLPMDGREAQRTLMTAKLDGVSRGLAAYVMKKDGCTYDFLYVTQPQRLSVGVEVFDRFVGSFRTIRSDAEGK